MWQLEKSHKKVPEFIGVYLAEIKKRSSGQKFVGTFYYAAIQISRQRYKSKYYDNIRDAARWYDLKLIEHGREPVNVLKRVVN